MSLLPIFVIQLSVGFQLGQIVVNGTKGSSDALLDPNFHLILPPPKRNSASYHQGRWHEVKVVASPNIESCCLPQDPQFPARTRKVQFTTCSPATVCMENAHTGPIRELGSPITDLCSTLDQFDATSPEANLDSTGHISSEQATFGIRYHMSLVRSVQHEVHVRSLQETLIGACPPKGYLKYSDQATAMPSLQDQSKISKFSKLD
jgi:hypothetical protein